MALVLIYNTPYSTVEPDRDTRVLDVKNNMVASKHSNRSISDTRHGLV